MMTARFLFFGKSTGRQLVWPVALPVLAILLSAPFADPTGPHSEFAVAVFTFSAISTLLLLVVFIAIDVIGIEGWPRHRTEWCAKFVILWLFAIASIAHNF